MGVTDATLSTITTGYGMKFREGLTSMSSAMPWQMFADETSSNDRQTTYPIKARPSRMRRWVGERIVRENEVYGYTLKNAKFEDTVAVEVDDIEDDHYDLYDKDMRGLGEAAGRLPWDEIVDAIKDGDVTVCYDGQFFFDTDHPLDPMGETAGVYSNDLASTALTHANVNVVRTAMATRLDKYGTVLGVRGTHLIVPEALRKTGEEIVRASTVATAQTNVAGTENVGASAPTNVLSGQFGLIVIPELDADSASTWYMADLTKSVKPFFWQWRKKPIFQRLTDMNSKHVIDTDQFIFGAKARGAAGYSLPQLMVRCAA